ncbi:hypothetical protein EDEG_01600 [Edhazardia aedis USNM 41457]|uniref:Exocyst complex component Sec3 C-terminal domain-containing protein n=1 Tax=Edhazardia aedis (strain USNM 41457) TaxID=1003232 RepID=J9DNL1_EDHAE|nr:hypothetical protein EDEG_01600 [Edhazardia aedis USNM 41457]|eukprot:EJW04120.1 hypothetical protein EDEG_01600 [Edhazardia aedis USNM 41457]
MFSSLVPMIFCFIITVDLAQRENWTSNLHTTNKEKTDESIPLVKEQHDKQMRAKNLDSSVLETSSFLQHNKVISQNKKKMLLEEPAEEANRDDETQIQCTDMDVDLDFDFDVTNSVIQNHRVFYVAKINQNKNEIEEVKQVSSLHPIILFNYMCIHYLLCVNFLKLQNINDILQKLEFKTDELILEYTKIFDHIKKVDSKEEKAKKECFLYYLNVCFVEIFHIKNVFDLNFNNLIFSVVDFEASDFEVLKKRVESLIYENIQKISEATKTDKLPENEIGLPDCLRTFHCYLRRIILDIIISSHKKTEEKKQFDISINLLIYEILIDKHIAMKNTNKHSEEEKICFSELCSLLIILCYKEICQITNKQSKYILFALKTLNVRFQLFKNNYYNTYDACENEKEFSIKLAECVFEIFRSYLSFLKEVYNEKTCLIFECKQKQLDLSLNTFFKQLHHYITELSNSSSVCDFEAIIQREQYLCHKYEKIQSLFRGFITYIPGFSIFEKEIVIEALNDFKNNFESFLRSLSFYTFIRNKNVEYDPLRHAFYDFQYFKLSVLDILVPSFKLTYFCGGKTLEETKNILIDNFNRGESIIMQFLETMMNKKELILQKINKMNDILRTTLNNNIENNDSSILNMKDSYVENIKLAQNFLDTTFVFFSSLNIKQEERMEINGFLNLFATDHKNYLNGIIKLDKSNLNKSNLIIFAEIFENFVKHSAKSRSPSLSVEFKNFSEKFQSFVSNLSDLSDFITRPILAENIKKLRNLLNKISDFSQYHNVAKDMAKLGDVYQRILLTRSPLNDSFYIQLVQSFNDFIADIQLIHNLYSQILWFIHTFETIFLQDPRMCSLHEIKIELNSLFLDFINKHEKLFNN